MAKLYPIKLYYYTGYDKGNLPDSPARLAEYQSKDFSPVHLWQDRGIAKVEINATWDDVEGADYVEIAEPAPSNRRTFFVLDGPPTVLNNGTVRLHLMLDPLASIGGISQLEVVAGWATRAHVSDDSMFANILPEQWLPSGRMIIRKFADVHAGDSAQYVAIAATTCDLMRLNEFKADLYKAADDAAEGVDVAVPYVPEVTEMSGTTVGISRPEGSLTSEVKYELPGIFLWQLGNPGGGIHPVFAERLAKLNSLGLNATLLALYIVRSDDITPTFSTGIHEHLFKSLMGNRMTETLDMPFKYGNFKNNKVYALYNTYRLVSNASANEITFDAHELYQDGQTEPTWVVQADPSPNGTIYIGPQWFEGRPTRRLEQCVAGLPWINAGYTFNEKSGGDIGLLNAARKNNLADYEANYAQMSQDVSYGFDQVRRGASVIGNVVKGVGGLAFPFIDGADTTYTARPSGLLGAVGSGVDMFQADVTHARDRDHREAVNNWEMGDRIFSAQTNARVTGPTLAFPVSANSAAYYGNSGTVYQVTLNDNDAKRLDDWLSAYGYHVDAKFITSQLSSRTKHNYIKTSGALVNAPGQPRWILSMIGRMFDNGVRIWHVKPSQADLIDNPIRS